MKPAKCRNYLTYQYNADGTKLGVLYATDSQTGTGSQGTIVFQSHVNSNTDYCDNLIYENGVLSKIMLPNGFLTKSVSGFVYHFFETDHQGNIRMVYNADQKTEQVNHFYPFGALFGPGSGGSLQPYKYGAKELERMYGLDCYDFEARLYDPVLCRFTTTDPMAEKYHWLSPYIYCMNNPVSFVDPTGKDIYRYDFNTGQFTLAIRNDDEYDQIGKFKLNAETGLFDLVTNRKGKPKTYVDNIEKGILSDGLNFMNRDYVFPVGEQGQATIKGFEGFITQFADLVRKEMDGYYLAKNGSETISYIGITHYKNNTYDEAKGVFMLPKARPDLYGKVYQHTDYHTHPSDAMGPDALNRSEQDHDRKERMLEDHPEVKKFILLINHRETKEY